MTNPQLKELLAEFNEKFVVNRREDGEEFDIPPYPSLRDKRIADLLTTAFNKGRENMATEVLNIIETGMGFNKGSINDEMFQDLKNKVLQLLTNHKEI